MPVSVFFTILFLLKYVKTCNIDRVGYFSEVQIGTALSEKHFFALISFFALNHGSIIAFQ